MKNVSRSSSCKFSSCFRPGVDLDAMIEPPKHHSSVSHHSHPEPTFSLLTKALSIQTRLNTKANRPPCRHGSKRRSSLGDERTILNQAAKASNIPETKSESPSSCWSLGLESENLSSSYANKPDHKESKREDRSEKKKRSHCLLGIFMLVLSLTLTVMVGKSWGIFLTSTWLYMFSLVKSRKEKGS